MAMANVACCSGSLGGLSMFLSPLEGRARGPTTSLIANPAAMNASLLRPLQQRNLQPLGRKCVRQLKKRETRSRGTAFASLRDAEELVRSGVVRLVPSAEVSGLLSDGGYALLDIRPTWERERAFVPGSYNIPLFVEDTSTGALSVLKRGIQQGQGGWWNGQKLTTRNEQFAEEVQAAVPPGQKLLVVCGEGLRSLLAVEELNKAGFEQLAWLAGGFIATRDIDFPQVEGPTKLRFATVGGVSEYVLKFAQFVSGVTKGKESLDST